MQNVASSSVWRLRHAPRRPHVGEIDCRSLTKGIRLNWLAHVFLSESNVEFRLGNLLADIVKGEELRRVVSPAFLRGVQKHKQIDAFTDSHPLVKRSRARISPQFRRFSGVLVDVFYDHLLATNWQIYSPIVLDAFTAKFYADIESSRLEL